MLTKLLSLTGNMIMMPLKNLPASIMFLTCFRITVLLYENIEYRKQLKLFPKIDDIVNSDVSGDVAAIQNLQKTAAIINKLKKNFPKDIAYKVDALAYIPASRVAPYRALVSSMDIAGRYAIIIDEKLFHMAPEQFTAILAHELSHIKCDHDDLFGRGARILAKANEVALGSSLLGTIFMGVMNIFSKQKQLPQMIALLALSIMVAKSCSFYLQKTELQADRESLLLNPNGTPHDLIAALQTMDSANNRMEEATIAENAVRPGKIIDLNNYFFSMHPDLETRKKALGITDESSSYRPN